MSSFKAFPNPAEAVLKAVSSCYLTTFKSILLTPPVFLVLSSGPLLTPLALQPLTHSTSVLPPQLALPVQALPQQSLPWHTPLCPCPLFLHLIHLAGSLCYCPYISQMANCFLGTMAFSLPMPCPPFLSPIFS